MKFLVTEENNEQAEITTITTDGVNSSMSNTYCGTYATLEDTGAGYLIRLTCHKEEFTRKICLDYTDVTDILYMAACLEAAKGDSYPLAMLTEMSNTIKWDK